MPHSKNKNKAKRSIWAIHGQLQSPTVWSEFKDTEQDWHCNDLWHRPWLSFEEWEVSFTANVIRESTSPRTLIGYSLGGRLAMWSLSNHPHLWDRAIIISADPGHSTPDIKKEQRQHDLDLSERFKTAPWAELMAEWQNQPIFQAAVSQPDTIAEEKRFAASHLLDVFSKGRQPDLTQGLIDSQVPITYISGEKDTKYTNIGKELAKAVPNLNHIVIPDAGHRVPWEAKRWFNAYLKENV